MKLDFDKSKVMIHVHSLGMIDPQQAAIVMLANNVGVRGLTDVVQVPITTIFSLDCEVNEDDPMQFLVHHEIVVRGTEEILYASDGSLVTIGVPLQWGVAVCQAQFKAQLGDMWASVFFNGELMSRCPFSIALTSPIVLPDGGQPRRVRVQQGAMSGLEHDFPGLRPIDPKKLN